jgi:hypothetical protein
VRKCFNIGNQSQFVNWAVKEMTELFYTLSRLDHKSSVIWTSIFEGPYHRNTRKA